MLAAYIRVSGYTVTTFFCDDVLALTYSTLQRTIPCTIPSSYVFSSSFVSNTHITFVAYCIDKIKLHSDDPGTRKWTRIIGIPICSKEKERVVSKNAEQATITVDETDGKKIIRSVKMELLVVA